MLRRSLSIALAAVLTVGLAGPALVNVPAWGYDLVDNQDETSDNEDDKQSPGTQTPPQGGSSGGGSTSVDACKEKLKYLEGTSKYADRLAQCYQDSRTSAANAARNSNWCEKPDGTRITFGQWKTINPQNSLGGETSEQHLARFLGSYDECNTSGAAGSSQQANTATDSQALGDLVFRFYGTADNPTAGYTVSMSNFGEEGLTKDEGIQTVTTPTNPSDATGQPRQPWSKYMAKESREAKEALEYIFVNDVPESARRVYEVESSKKNTLYTTGAPVVKQGASCAAYSQPAAHQAGGVQGGITEELANARVSNAGEVSYNQPGGLFNAIEGWADAAWNLRGNDQLKARLLGLSGTNTELNMSTIASSDYVQCGSPINYPTYIGEERVLERNEEGWPTRVSMPGLGEVKTTATAKIQVEIGCGPGFFEEDCFEAKVYHADKDKEVRNQAYFRTAKLNGDPLNGDRRTPSGFGAGNLDLNGLYGAGTEDAVIRKVEQALESFYSGNKYKDLYPAKLDAQFKKIKGSGSSKQVAVEDINPRDVVRATDITLNPAFVTLDPNLLPTLEEVGAGGGDDNTVDGPITEQPEEGPTFPNNPPQPTPDPNGFVWSIEAEATPYLEVKADQGPANTFEFRAKLESEWRSRAEAEAFIDGLAVSSTTSGFNNAKGAWNSLASQVSGTPGVGLAAAQLTGEKRADFSGRDWDLKAIYEGLDTYTYVPQCNTGQKQGPGCESDGSAWNQAPVLNDDCNSPACYEPGQVVNNATRGGEGIGPSGTLPYTNYRIGGPGVKMGAWSYDFFKATGKDKAVYLAHEASRPTDIDVRYDANNPGAASWYVNGRYKTWDPIYGPPYAVYEPCTKWVPFDPPQYHSDGAEATYPTTDSCYAGTRRDLIGYQPSGWKGWGRSGAYTRYNVADNLSGVAVDPETQRVVRSDTFGGAGCDDRNSTAWNYCSPVLAGKVTR